MSTFEFFFEPRCVLVQVGTLLLQRPTHLFMGEPVQFLASQAAVNHLEDK